MYISSRVQFLISLSDGLGVYSAFPLYNTLAVQNPPSPRGFNRARALL